MDTTKKIVYIDADLEDIMPGFLNNRREDIKALAQALQDKDFTKLKLIGHDLKGVGGGYGFPYITELGGCIEAGAATENLPQLKGYVNTLSSYLEQIEVVYQ